MPLPRSPPNLTPQGGGPGPIQLVATGEEPPRTARGLAEAETRPPRHRGVPTEGLGGIWGCALRPGPAPWVLPSVPPPRVLCWSPVPRPGAAVPAAGGIGWEVTQSPALTNAACPLLPARLGRANVCPWCKGPSLVRTHL